MVVSTAHGVCLPCHWSDVWVRSVNPCMPVRGAAPHHHTYHTTLDRTASPTQTDVCGGPYSHEIDTYIFLFPSTGTLNLFNLLLEVYKDKRRKLTKTITP